MKPRESNAVSNGALLGSANALFIAIAMSCYTREGADMAVFVFLIGMVPGLFTGMVLGAIAGLTAQRNIWLRRALIAIPAIGLVVALGLFFQVGPLIAPAAIPTIVCTLILERSTRYVAPLPLASVH
ncbi:MAG: hypothetical protein ABI591_07625 [Kofleriaceae bacterium]